MDEQPTLRSPEQQSEWVERQRTRERQKIIGVMLVILFLVALAFVRFGKTIPWGAR